MIAVLAAAVAGAVGAAARYGVTRSLPSPWGVLAVNVVGSAIGGVVLGLAERAAVGADVKLILLGGLCGGLTTFSTFSVDTIELVRAGHLPRALLSVGANLVLGLLATLVGYLLAR